MLGGKKQQFYVQFLGWVETYGMRGTRYTDPVINDLRRKAKKWKYAPKLTLQVGKKEMKITQDIQDLKGKKIKTIKFPIIPSRDITFAVQALNPVDGSLDDVVACIYLGYVPRTQRYVHVHVYRFDSSETATTFVRFLNQIISMNADRMAEIERSLIQQGHIEEPQSREPITVHVRTSHVAPNNNRFNSSDGMSDRAFYEDSGADSGSFSDEGFPSGSDDIEPDLQSLKDAVPFDSVTDELKARLRLTETQGAAPLLLPPKDYDTIVRRHGDVEKASKRKCLQIPIVGGRTRNGSDESGIEVPSPTSSEGRANSMNNSDDKITSSVHSGSVGVNTPPRTPSTNYDVYPPMTSPRSPLTSQSSAGYDQYPRKSRPASSSSAGIRNIRSSENFSDLRSSAVIYTGPSQISEIPPDYEVDDAPILRQTSGNYSHRDLTKSMPSEMLRKEMEYGYAVLPKRLERQNSGKYSDSAALSPRVDMNYGDRRSGAVRRVNSMYR